jgi:hypothetical protein
LAITDGGPGKRLAMTPDGKNSAGCDTGSLFIRFFNYYISQLYLMIILLFDKKSKFFNTVILVLNGGLFFIRSCCFQGHRTKSLT